MVARPLDDAGLDALLRALASGPRALIPVAELPDRWGLDADDAVDTAAELVADGWLEEWIGADDQAVILSSRSAERLQIELHPPDSADLTACRWLPIGTGKPAPPPRGVALETDVESSTMSQDGPHGFLDSRPDPRAADACKEAVAPSNHEARLSRPRHLLGTDAIWVHHDPLPAGEDEPGRCAACHGRTLRADQYCLACDNSNSPLMMTDLNITPTRRPLPPLPDWLAGGRGKATPKKAATTPPTRKPKTKKAARNSFRAELAALAGR
jgi:hypothetical protein